MNGRNNNVLTFIVMIVSMIFVTVGSIIFNWVSCGSKASVMQKEYSFGIISGCMIKTEKGFIPLENMRGME